MLVLEEDALDAKEANNTAKAITIMTQAMSLAMKVATTPVVVAVKAVEVAVMTVDVVVVVNEAMVAVITALSLDMKAMIGLTALATLRVIITNQTFSCIQKAVPMAATTIIIMAATTVLRTKMPMSMMKTQWLMLIITLALLIAMLNVALLRSIGLIMIF